MMMKVKFYFASKLISLINTMKYTEIHSFYREINCSTFGCNFSVKIYDKARTVISLNSILMGCASKLIVEQ